MAAFQNPSSLKRPSFRAVLVFASIAISLLPLAVAFAFPRYGLIAAVGVAAAASVFAALFLSRRITKSLDELTQVVASVSRGDLHSSPDTKFGYFKETTELASAINEMLRSLRHNAQEVEDLVSRYTGDLTCANQELETLAVALRHAGEAVEIVDPDGRYMFVNPAFEALTGYSAKEALGKHAADLLESEDRVNQLLAASFKAEGEKIFRGSSVGYRKNGIRFEQEVTLAGVFTEDGVLKYIVGIRRDVTELRRTQEALRVRDRLASVGTLAAGVAHEINNPLTYVIANLSYAATVMEELKQEKPFSTDLEDFEEALIEAKEGAERVKSIVQDLKTFARTDTDSIGILDVNSVLESSLKMVANEIRHSAGLSLELNNVPAVLGNESKLGQVFINLLVNAVQALPEGKALSNQIGITTKCEDKSVVVTVSDTGCGMSEETLSHAFDPFYTTKQVGVGTGLGLCICHNIVNAMGGAIRIESRKNRGTSVFVQLPEADLSKLETKCEVPVEPKRLDHRPRVLVIDDEAPVGKAFRRILNDCRVDVAESGVEGFKLMQTTDHDVVFCDLMMPDMSGMDLYNRVQVEIPEKADGMIFMTGGVFTQAAEEFVNESNRPVLHKPFDSEKIRQLVSDWTNRNVVRAIHESPLR
jgi:PAS domain S-box-containing protein